MGISNVVDMYLGRHLGVCRNVVDAIRMIGFVQLLHGKCYIYGCFESILYASH